MKLPSLLAFCIATPLSLFAQNPDLIVYGGTPGGITTAVAAAREGLSVVLLETTKHLGGMTTGGLSHTDVGPKPEIIGGLAREFFSRTNETYHDPERTLSNFAHSDRCFWFHEPHIAEQVFTEMLKEAGVKVIWTDRLASVEKSGAKITSISTVSGKQFHARLFADATYEGDLMASAGISYTFGRESTNTYGESLAGVQPAVLRLRAPEYMSKPGTAYTHGTPVVISAYKDGKLLTGINPDWPALGSGDNKSQAYNFRVILTNRDSNRIPFPKPAHYDPLRYEILARMIDAYPGIRFEKLVFLGALPNAKFDANASGLVQGTDHVGGNVQYPDGDTSTRDKIWQDHVDYVQGLFWFLANDPRVPEEMRNQASQYGLPKDEFTDNASWPYALYVREARRMIGPFVMRQEDCTKSITKPDSIAMGAFILDSHAVQRLVNQDGNVVDEGNFDVPVKPYQIPYRCVTPQKEQCENLLVPVALSASHVTYGSIRMEPQFMMIGHSAGVAAAMAVKQNLAVQDIDIASLQEKLRTQKQVLALPASSETSLSRFQGIVVDDDEAIYIGEWGTSTFGEPLGGGSHHDGDSAKGHLSARFNVKIPSTGSGRYDVRLAYTAAQNRASNVPVTIETISGRQLVTVNEKLTPPIEKRFVSLGIFNFSPTQPAVITINNSGTDGFVVIDALQLIAQ